MVVRRMDVAPRPVNPMGVPARTITMESSHVRDHMSPSYSTARPSPNVQIADAALYHRARTRTRSPSPVRGPHHGEVGFGGFPGPREVVSAVSSKFFPKLHRNLQQTLTMPRTATLIPQNQDPRQIPGATRRVPYLSFTADVGKNSHFQHLDEEQMLELGGVEYRALNALMWITPLVSDINQRHD